MKRITEREVDLRIDLLSLVIVMMASVFPLAVIYAIVQAITGNCP